MALGWPLQVGIVMVQEITLEIFEDDEAILKEIYRRPVINIFGSSANIIYTPPA